MDKFNSSREIDYASKQFYVPSSNPYQSLQSRSLRKHEVEQFHSKTNRQSSGEPKLLGQSVNIKEFLSNSAVKKARFSPPKQMGGYKMTGGSESDMVTIYSSKAKIETGSEKNGKCYFKTIEN